MSFQAEDVSATVVWHGYWDTGESICELAKGDRGDVCWTGGYEKSQ